MALPYLQPGSASRPPISDAPERVGQSDDVLAKDSFVARVAAHEQRHVDIYLEGAKAMKARMEATRTAVSCTNLEKAIDAEWRAQQTEIERAQAEFHAVDETTARSEREDLQARLDGTRARLEPVDAEIRCLDTELADRMRHSDAGRAEPVAHPKVLTGQTRSLTELYNISVTPTTL